MQDLDTKRKKKCAILSLTINWTLCTNVSIVLFCFIFCLLHEALFNKTSVTFKPWQTVFLHSVLKKMCASSHPEWKCWWDMRRNNRLLGQKSFLWDNFLDLSYSGCVHALQRGWNSEIRRRDLSKVCSCIFEPCDMHSSNSETTMKFGWEILFFFASLLFSSRNQRVPSWNNLGNFGFMSLSRIYYKKKKN